MFAIHYPEPSFRVKKEKGREHIFDALRKKWLLLTPEEWVRQNFIQHLVQVLQYAPALIAQEKMIKVGELSRRFDILVYDRHHRPFMLGECKAPEVALDETVWRQALTYYSHIQSGIMVITNGHHAAAWQKENNRLTALGRLPASAEI